MIETTTKLNQLLVLLTNQYYLLKHYHWNFTGNMFFQYHQLFDEFSVKVFASQDEIAERIRQLGDPVNLVTAHVSEEISSFHTPSTNQDNLFLILEFLIANTQNTIKFMESIIFLANQENDYSTADILTNFLEEQQKYEWFLRSSLKN